MALILVHRVGRLQLPRAQVLMRPVHKNLPGPVHKYGGHTCRVDLCTGYKNLCTGATCALVLRRWFVDKERSDCAARLELLRLCLSDVKLADDVDLEQVADGLDGYSGADVTSVCRDAAMMTMRRRVAGLEPDQIRALSKEELDAPVCADDFAAAIKNTNKSVSPNDLDKYESWMQEFGST